MSMEYFDIVDENGVPTGKIKLREEVHRDGDWHRTAHIWVIDRQNRVLLQRRSPLKDGYPNMLDVSSAGHFDAGENSVTAAMREIGEELGIFPKADELQFGGTIKSKHRQNGFVDNEITDIYFLHTSLTEQEMSFCKEEISEIKFYDFEELSDMVNNNQPDLLMNPPEFELLKKHITEQL